MKYSLYSAGIFLITAALFFSMAGCENEIIRSSYTAVLPELPEHWQKILGKAHWRLEWIDPEGYWQYSEVLPGKKAAEINPATEWTTPILAWPFWPAFELEAETMKPAGALFPWDASKDKIILGWEGGVEAFLWKEMAAAERDSSSAEKRLPWYFDWPRLRELFRDEATSEQVRNDPWLADWKSIAQKTIQSGFDRRRITSRKYSKFSVPKLGGEWIGSSPFAASITAPSEGPLVLNVCDVPNIWISAKAILKCSTAGYVLRQLDAK